MPELISEKILIVYDSPGIRETISLLGDNAWPDVIEIDNPQKTLQVIRTAKPDLVLLCALSSNPSTYTTCKKIKTEFADSTMPVMIISLRGDHDNIARARKAGADDTLQLSISTNDLLLRIRTMLQIRKVALQTTSNSGQKHQHLHSSSETAGKLEKLEARISLLEKELKQLTNQIGKNI